jgi:hypothetical protein
MKQLPTFLLLLFTGWLLGCTVEPTADTATPASPIQAEGPSDTAAQPTPHAESNANKTGVFELASGEVQLVEFFAHW